MVILAIACLAIIPSGCATGGEVKGRLGEEFSLQSGQIARITDENLKIEFVEIVEDSRCPKGVTCVWAGQVVAKVRISSGGLADVLLLTEPGLTDEYARESYQQYQLSYHVEPYPEQGKMISKYQYQLLLLVSK